MRVAFAPAATRDIEEIGDYIHADNPAAALRFIRALRARCAKIGGAPKSGVARPSLWPGLRSLPFRRYVIFYTLGADSVRIERVLHGARDVAALFDDDGG